MTLETTAARPATVPRVVVVGAGFGGLYAVRGLKDAGYKVTLIDKNLYSTFQPLLYQVATGGAGGPDPARRPPPRRPPPPPLPRQVRPGRADRDRHRGPADHADRR